MDFFETVAQKIASGTEYGKQLGRQVVQQAATTGRAARDGIVDTARTVRDKTVETARAAADQARAGAEWTKQKAGEGLDWGKEKGRQAAQAAGDGVDWAKQKAGEGVDWAKQKAGEGVDWVKQKGKQFDNWVVGGIASGIGNLATKNQTVERCIEDMARNKARVADPRDGQFMGNDCPKTSPNPPKTGRLPKGCAGSAGKLPKIIYTNGINTTPEAACATMHNIADQRCAEVIGVYNATYGTVEDALDSKDNIDRAGREPAAHSQARLLTEMLDKNPPQRVTLYSHSQGGLITQEGLTEGAVSMREKITDNLIEQGMGRAEAKQEAARQTRKKMSQVDVYSFGTAEKEWPQVGAQYHQFTNTADPVPKLIGAVQSNRGLPYDPTNLVERHRFTKNAWNPIDPHSMDTTYIPELNRVHPVPKKANGQCC